jgi:single-strand DNA-binding protein
MARGKNLTILIGYVGADPDIVTRDNCVVVATVNLATTEVWKDKESGEKKERTEWHRAKFFAGRATAVAEHVKKGTLLFVRGRLRTDKYTDKEDIVRYSTEVVVDDFEMLTSARPGTDVVEDDES